MKRSLIAVLLFTSLLAACSKKAESDDDTRARAAALLGAQCQQRVKMIPGIKPEQVTGVCACWSEQATVRVALPDLRQFLKDREFAREAEQVMRGVRNDCAARFALN